MAMTEKIKILLAKRNMKTADLAQLLNTKPSNIYSKFRRNNFSEKDLEKIAEVLSCKYEGNFVMEGGDRI